MLSRLSSSKIFLAWSALIIAIIAEVIGTSIMAETARNQGYVGYIIMALALALSYYFLALSVRQIAIGVAYAVWEGMGLVLLTLIGIFIFKDTLSLIEFTGLGLVILGIICVAFGEEH